MIYLFITRVFVEMSSIKELEVDCLFWRFVEKAVTQYNTLIKASQTPQIGSVHPLSINTTNTSNIV